jgi:RNA polymerase sigma-70 factor, ECF subfamily
LRGFVYHDRVLSHPLPTLSRAFCGRLAPSLAAKLGDVDALELRLRSLLEEARRAAPDVAVDEVAFVGHLAERIAGEEDIEEALSSVLTADLLLAFACLAGDAAALRELGRRIDVEVHAALRTMGPSPGLADEVRSILTERLLVGHAGAPKLGTYAGLGPLSAWIRVAALRMAISLRRRGRREAPLDDRALLTAMDPGADPEARLLRERHAEDFRSAVCEALAALSSRDRNLLRMYYAEGIKLDKLGTIYRVNASTISRWIARAREEVLDRTRAALTARLKLSASQVESLLGVAQSLDVSLETLLGRAAG